MLQKHIFCYSLLNVFFSYQNLAHDTILSLSLRKVFKVFQYFTRTCLLGDADKIYIHYAQRLLVIDFKKPNQASRVFNLRIFLLPLFMFWQKDYVKLFPKYIAFMFNTAYALPVLSARCGGVLSEMSGVILSPGFPGNYPGNLDCTWQITLPTGYGENYDLLSLI